MTSHGRAHPHTHCRRAGGIHQHSHHETCGLIKLSTFIKWRRLAFAQNTLLLLLLEVLTIIIITAATTTVPPRARVDRNDHLQTPRMSSPLGGRIYIHLANGPCVIQTSQKRDPFVGRLYHDYVNSGVWNPICSLRTKQCLVPYTRQ